MPSPTSHPISSRRMLTGAIAGLVATFAMTAAMRQLHRRLPPEERYPLPPRELTERIMPEEARRVAGESGVAEATVAAHFGYGAAAGAFLPLVSRRPSIATGGAYGVVVWLLSYLGWIPGFRILKPATDHPFRRNLLMIVVHLVWGTSLAIAHRELRRAEKEIFAAGPHRDATSAHAGDDRQRLQ